MSSQQIPASIQRQTCNVLETISNLLYLAEMEAYDPQKVRIYLSLSKERLQAMAQLLIRNEDGGNNSYLRRAVIALGGELRESKEPA
jgi:hypothetical protein